MEKPPVSICISVHNTAKYLRRCLDCVCNQTLKNIEIVLVNNGSTDDSENIMKEYKNKFNGLLNIKIYSQKDLGLAQGRQTGVANANGEYIAFLDADDLVKKDTFKILYTYAKQKNLDIVEMKTKRDDIIISSGFQGEMDARKYWEKLIRFEKIPSMLWLRIYRKELFVKSVFPSIYTNNEDMFALPCLVYSAKSIGFINEVLHTYSTDNESAVMKELNDNPNFSLKKYDNRKKVLFTVNHLSNYIGLEMDENIRALMIQYKWHVIINFLFEKFDKKISYNDKINAIINNIGFESKGDVEKFIKVNAYCKNTLCVFIKLFGVKNTYFLYNILRRSK